MHHSSDTPATHVIQELLKRVQEREAVRALVKVAVVLLTRLGKKN